MLGLQVHRSACMVYTPPAYTVGVRGNRYARVAHGPTLTLTLNRNPNSDTFVDTQKMSITDIVQRMLHWGSSLSYPDCSHATTLTITLTMTMPLPPRSKHKTMSVQITVLPYTLHRSGANNTLHRSGS